MIEQKRLLRFILNNRSIGDIWSYCIFDKSYWRNGIATEALKLFIKEICETLHLKTFGAFTYSEKVSSIRVLEKNNFELIETIMEDNIESKYYQYEI